MSKRIIDDVTKSNKKSKHQVTTIITIYYQILCKSQELIENDEIQINARSSLIEMKKKICSSFEGLKPDDILEIIKDESNKKLLSSDDNKILSSLEFNHEDSITIILNPEWMDDEAEKVTEEKTFEVEKILGHKCLSNKKSPQGHYHDYFYNYYNYYYYYYIVIIIIREICLFGKVERL